MSVVTLGIDNQLATFNGCGPTVDVSLDTAAAMALAHLASLNYGLTSSEVYTGSYCNNNKCCPMLILMK
jgi:hypothetical protein